MIGCHMSPRCSQRPSLKVSLAAQGLQKFSQLLHRQGSNIPRKLTFLLLCEEALLEPSEQLLSFRTLLHFAGSVAVPNATGLRLGRSRCGASCCQSSPLLSVCSTQAVVNARCWRRSLCLLILGRTSLLISWWPLLIAAPALCRASNVFGAPHRPSLLHRGTMRLRRCHGRSAWCCLRSGDHLCRCGCPRSLAIDCLLDSGLENLQAAVVGEAEAHGRPSWPYQASVHCLNVYTLHILEQQLASIQEGKAQLQAQTSILC
mmetsp:Transcript_2607/g.4207  ORF Transcript_2607/g.4207 Transcript_2607/m.4207 type:complete len:260 (-) Transcript_2607:121-900(-)